MSDIDEVINKALDQVGDSVSDEIKTAVEGVVRNVFERGMLPKDAMGINDNLIEGMYGHAYRLYNAGQYNEALQLFKLLTILNPSESKFIMGMAAAYHLQKEYTQATTTYALVAVVDPENPAPHYHASDCYIKMGLIGAAINELEKTIELCGNKPPYAMVKDRASMMLEQLKNDETATAAEQEQESKEGR